MVVNTIAPWLLIIGASQVILFFLGIYFFMNKQTWKTFFENSLLVLRTHLLPVCLIISIVLLHLVEVNFIDPLMTTALGNNFTSMFVSLEDSLVLGFSAHQVLPLTSFCVFIYLMLYPFTLWFTPVYLLITNDKTTMKLFAYSAGLIYAITLPFYLFFPITNVYTYFGASSSLNPVLPGIDQFFYVTTTNNNCFPSLHVAMALLIAQTIRQTNNKRFTYVAYFCAGAVIISVMYLAIHWITDVIGGIILSLLVFYLVQRKVQGSSHETHI